MSYLTRARKEDLLELADELRIVIAPNSKIVEIRDIILNSDDYDEESKKDLLETIISVRVDKEKLAAERAAVREKFAAEIAKLVAEKEKLIQEREKRRIAEEIEAKPKYVYASMVRVVRCDETKVESSFIDREEINDEKESKRAPLKVECMAEKEETKKTEVAERKEENGISHLEKTDDRCVNTFLSHIAEPPLDQAPAFAPVDQPLPRQRDFAFENEQGHHDITDAGLTDAPEGKEIPQKTEEEEKLDLGSGSEVEEVPSEEEKFEPDEKASHKKKVTKNGELQEKGKRGRKPKAAAKKADDSESEEEKEEKPSKEAKLSKEDAYEDHDDGDDYYEDHRDDDAEMLPNQLTRPPELLWIGDAKLMMIGLRPWTNDEVIVN